MSNAIEDGLRTLSVRQLAVSMNLPTWRIYEMIALDAAPPFMRIGKTLASGVLPMIVGNVRHANDRSTSDSKSAGGFGRLRGPAS